VFIRGEEVELLKIPKAAENLEAATIGKWLKKAGEAVKAGEPVVELLTDKADFALEAETSGYLRHIAATEKSTIPVGYIIGVIAGKNEQLPDVDSFNRELIESSATAAQPRANTKPRRSKPRPAGVRTAATPAARKLAKENNVELADVARALGKTGVISADDVQQYLASR